MPTGTTVEITMPQMGDSVTEGTVLEWHRQVGDRVEVDETIVEISTDKVDAEVPAPAAGILVEIKAQPDDTVEVGAVLGVIQAGGEADTGDAPTGDDSPEAESESAPAGDDSPADAPADAPSGDGELVDVTFPQMGDSVSEGTIIEWLKQVGDAVEANDTIVEISTDKVDAEVPAPVAGTIAEILAEPDETVTVGAVLCRIAAGASAPAGGKKPAAEPESSSDGATPAASAGNGANATPVAARAASAHGIDLAKVSGTGPRGRVTKEDVMRAVDGGGPGAGDNGGGAASSAPAPPEGAETKPIRGPAATLVRFMNESRSLPTATSFRTLEVGELDSRRRALKAAGHKLSFTHLIAWAIVRAARDWPVMGHGYAEVDGKPQRVVPGGLNLGLAVDVERKDGARSLVVPVLHGADQMDLPAFVARYDELVVGARDNTLGPDAYQGAHISLTNPGGLGTVASVPRLMPGQGTIVATGSIAFPAGLRGADPQRLSELGVAKVMTMTSTYDHRIIQGAESGSFLRRIDELLQGEDGFYDEIFAALGIADGTAPAQVTADEPVPAAVLPAADTAAGAVPSDSLLQAVQAATSIVKAHRMHGHLAAQLDPLGADPPGDPALDPETVNLTPSLMTQIPARVLRVAVPGETFADALPHLRTTYCGTIAYEIEHISDHEQRVWLRQMVESGSYREPLTEAEKRQLFSRLCEVEALEGYLRKAFLGRKQFSIEGSDVLIPMLDEVMELAATEGTREVLLGMAHRGRLNVLAHSVGRPYESILVEFEAESNLGADTAMPEGGTGDVKYHYGASGTYKPRREAKSVTVSLSPNPSHLEYVNPVLEGRARADQTSRKGREAVHDPELVLPVLIHGDAAFPGQGVVAETLNLQALAGYATGGTVHIICNNQLGFTTNPEDARSTRYASDLAKGFDVPIIHVNADDVEACIAAVRLAHAFRERFRRDALIDVVGYRRFGHNESDEPAYTQPEMYALIKDHPPVRELYAKQLSDEGIVSEEEAAEILDERYRRLAEAHSALRESMAAGPETGEHELDRSASVEPKTALPGETLRTLNEHLLRVPEGFTVHRKLQKPMMERRREALGPEGGIDWAQAEALAWASLLCQGVPIRLTGQDVERGTFSQRHLVLHDSETGAVACPMQNLPNATAPFELHNSPLSEVACLGFEYGYSVQAPDALVMWEGQFGDFVNSAQVIVDQFIVSGLSKWGQTSRLTLLLPHGYEGSGPEHSSGRLERFLQLAAEGNIRVANCTTPAQHYHLLRRQALVSKARPLVIMTPKSLLRHPRATSTLEELTDERGFQWVIDDPEPRAPRERITRLVLCSGKVYYDITGHDAREEARHVAVARVELLYPFAANQIKELMASYPSLREVVWVQEEPRNMGARSFMKPKLDAILPDGVAYSYVGREWRASPGEGYAAAHRAEQERIVLAALESG